MEAWVGEDRQHLQLAVDEIGRADELVEVLRQIALDPSFDMTLEQVAEPDAGDGESDKDGDRRGRPEPETDRTACHAFSSGIR